MRCFIYYDLKPSDQAQTCFLMSKSEGDKRRFPIDFYTCGSLFGARATATLVANQNLHRGQEV